MSEVYKARYSLLYLFSDLFWKGDIMFYDKLLFQSLLVWIMFYNIHRFIYTSDIRVVNDFMTNNYMSFPLELLLI